MKKKMLLSLMTIFAVVGLTGCSTSSNKVMTCTKTETDEDGYKTEETIKVSYGKDKYVTNIDATAIIEADESYTDMMIGFMQAFGEEFNKIGGINYSISKEGNNKVKQVISVDYKNLDVDKLKEIAGEDGDSTIIVNPNETHVTIDEFKKNELEGYTCK